MFTLCLAVGSASVGTDRPAALAPRPPELQAGVPALAPSPLVVTRAANSWHRLAVWRPIPGVAGSIGPAGAQDRAVLVYVGTPPLAGVRFLPPEGFFTVYEGVDVVNVEGIAD